MTASLARRPGPPVRLLGTTRRQFLRFPIALSLAELSAAFIVSALVDLTDDAEVTVAFLLVGAGCGAVAALELSRVPMPDTVSPPAVMTMTTVSWLALAAGGAAAHLLADADVNLDGAIFEGMAPVTTTAMTGVDIDSLPRGLLQFRALMQWLGGFGGIVVAVIVIPLVAGGRELLTRTGGTGGRPIITGRMDGAHRLLAIYGGFTAIMSAGYLVAGMGAFDAFANAMATVSTGGLSTRTGSLGAFDDAAVEWVATGGMALAGVSIAVVWWVLRGQGRAALRSSELRTYAGLFAIGSLALAIWLSTDDAIPAGVRTGLFAAASAVSTTGFTTTDWWQFSNASQVLLLVLIGIGSMSGSAGGGFRPIRVLQAFRYAARELTRQLHPNAVGVVRIDRKAVPERALDRLTSYIIMFIVTAIVASMLVELGDSEVSPSAAITLAVSALSTAGPQLIDPIALGELGAVSKMSLATLMLLGRLSIYGVILAVMTVAFRLGQYTRQRLPRRLRW